VPGCPTGQNRCFSSKRHQPCQPELLRSVENLNRLAANQQLRFALNGLTVIYGDNGSGKSGYARIAKKLCRSLAPTDLIGDVFKAGKKPPAMVNADAMELLQRVIDPDDPMTINGACVKMGWRHPKKEAFRASDLWDG
jgi:ABC-type cobalamin/Fe3+-siderophores transport system ATPase subunit